MAADRSWTFLTNHGHMLVAVARSPDARVQELAEAVGVSPRGALSILADLEDAGYLRRERRGRRTHYTLRPHQPFRHPSTAAHEVDELLAIFAPSALSVPSTQTATAAATTPGPARPARE